MARYRKKLTNAEVLVKLEKRAKLFDKAFQGIGDVKVRNYPSWTNRKAIVVKSDEGEIEVVVGINPYKNQKRFWIRQDYLK